METQESRLQRISLTEYSVAPDVPLTSLQLHQLQAMASSVVIQPSAHLDAHYDLAASSSIGLIQLDGLQIAIHPKVPIGRVMFLISYAINHGRWRDEPAMVEQADDLVEALVLGFAYQLRRALARGILQGYREVEESAQTVRGRWRIGEQIRTRYGIAPPVEVAYDDFTEDIEANRLLRAAMHRVLSLPMRDDHLRWGLRSIDSALSSVSVVSYDARRVPVIRYDRRSERYRPAVELARLILQSTSYDTSHGDVAASAFLIDMNRVFEDFVVLALRDALPPSAGRLVQGNRLRGLYLDEKQRINLQPDLSLWIDGECRFVGDVKYKRLRLTAYPNADLYQLLAYATAVRLDSGLLIYAAGEEEPATHRVSYTGKILETLALNLDCPPKELLEQVKKLAARINVLAEGRAA